MVERTPACDESAGRTAVAAFDVAPELAALSTGANPVPAGDGEDAVPDEAA
jgi:hypothetical protein